MSVRIFAGSLFWSLSIEPIHSVHYIDILYSLLHVAVEKELKSRLEWWKEKQIEIENEFKVVYQTQDKVPKDKHKRRKEEVSSHNQALSSYAAMLTVEFLVKVGLINFSKNIY